MEKAIKTPEWIHRTSIYQITPRTFSQEGTINAVKKELPNIKKLGFETIYLCPVFAADDDENKEFWSKRQTVIGNPKNPYRIKNYFEIDSEYGTMDDLKDFIASAHGLGIRVILDLVYFHIGPTGDIIKTHPEFVRRDKNGKIECGDWHFPILNFDCEGLREYLWCNMTYYIGVLDADGFRCDVGDLVPIDFWKEGKRRITAIKPDAVMINEGDNLRYLKECFDACYFWPWPDPTHGYFIGNNDAKGIRELDEKHRKNLPEGGLRMRSLENHDCVVDWEEIGRLETTVGHEGMELMEVMNYSLDGIPLVYAGNEIADESHQSILTNRFHRAGFVTLDRSVADKPYSIRRQKVMAELNKLKKENDIFDRGKTVWIDHDSEEAVVAFKRVGKNGTVTFVGNLSDKEVTANIPLGDDYTVLAVSETVPAVNAKSLTLPPKTYILTENK